MTKDQGNQFSQKIYKFFNIFTFCSRPSASYNLTSSSYSNILLVSTPVLTRSNIYLSSKQINRNHLKLPFYSTTFTSIDQKSLSHRLMPQIDLVDSEFSTHNDDITHHVVNDDDRTRQKEPVSSPSSSSSSSSTSNCQSSLTIHQCYSTSTIPSATMTEIEILNNRTDIIENSSSLPPPPPPTSSRFSYIIRPTTPCIFGREYDAEEMNDDEFFVTAGGIVHSCPNIYELSTDNHRKLQSCDHLIFLDQQPTLINDDKNNNNLNCYDTEFDRYSILPRFQPISSSISTDSMNSELELYKERHAIGLSRQYHDNTLLYSSSFLPTTWKSDNYLLFMPYLHHHSSLLNSIDHGKRSRSYDMPNGQTYSSVVV